MGRTYAEVLGLLAFTIILSRGWIIGGGTDEVLLAAIGALFLFAAIGFAAGAVAESIVLDWVRWRFQAELLRRGKDSQSRQPAAKRS